MLTYGKDGRLHHIILEPLQVKPSLNKRIIDGQCFSLDLIIMLKGNAARRQTRPPK
jgi:hypothetical protein